MASYTMQLRVFIEQVTQFEVNLSVKEKIERGRLKLFDFDYPIYSDDYRKIFETNFIRHFYMREIGFETDGLFKFRLETWLLIHMPYFNKMFESELIEYDPLINASTMVTHDKVNNTDKKDEGNRSQKADGESVNKGDSNKDHQSSSTGKDDDFTRKVGSDNPDSRLQLQTQEGKGVIEYAGTIDEVKVNNSSNLTNQSNDKVHSNNSSNFKSNLTESDMLKTNIDETEFFIQKRLGKIGVVSQSKLIMDYRNALLRIEKQIFNEMNELFMLVY